MICQTRNCDICNPASTCSSCLSGFDPVTSNGVTYCVSQCGTGQINAGNATNPSCTTCSQAISNCDSCSSATICTTCRQQYFVTGAGACSYCNDSIAFCRTCSSATTCSTCFRGKNLINNACVDQGCASTVQNCLHCANTNTICTTCANGFTNNNGSCTVTCQATYSFDATLGQCACAAGTY